MSAELIERTANVYLPELPSQSEIDAMVARVDSASTTLPNILLEIMNSASREIGPADEMARLFFILFDRAPDAVLFNQGMDLMRQGATLDAICEAGLALTGANLNSSLNLSNTQFVERLADAMWSVRPAGFDIKPFVDVLSEGSMSRSELLAAALSYDDALIRYTNNIDTALTYLAVANRQATEEELTLYRNTPQLPLVRQIVEQAAPDALGSSPYWTIAGPTIFLEGSYDNALAIDLENRTASLGASNTFSLTLTRDGGFTESPIQFQSSLLNGITRLDARGLTAADDRQTLIAIDSGSTIYAGAVTSMLQGGAGNDSLFGNTSDDTLFGLGGHDLLTGGAGADTFRFNPPNAYDGTALTTVSDFGRGSDILDLSQLIGTAGEDAAEATVISGVSDPAASSVIALTELTRNSVAVVEHTGIWPTSDAAAPATSNALTPRTATQVADLFANVTFADTPERSAKYVVITTDPQNGADVWLIENYLNLSTIEEGEITKIGHLDSQVDLFGQLTQSGAIIA